MQNPADSYTTTVLLKVIDVDDAHGRKFKQIVAVPERFYAYANPDFEVIFESERHPFAIEFEDGSPLAGKPQYSGEETGPYRLTQKVRPDAARVKPYKYTITMCVDDRILTADPDGVLEMDPNRPS